MGIIQVELVDVNPLAAMSNLDLAYLAGLFDGEGCISATIRPPQVNRREQQETIHAAISMSNTYQSIVEWAHTVTGLGSVKRYEPRSERHRPSWLWIVAANEAELILRRLLPFMRIKHVQASLLIELQGLRQQSRRGYRHSPERQTEIVHSLHDLNNGRYDHSDV